MAYWTRLALLLLGALTVLSCGGEPDPSVPAGGEDAASAAAATLGYVPAEHPWVGDWDALVTRVQSALQQEFPGEAAELRFLLADSEQIHRTLVRNVRARFADPEQAEVDEAGLKVYAQALLGIYDLDQKVVRIALPHFESMSKLLERPELTSDSALFAVMVHEGIHAILDRRHGLAAFFGQAQAGGDEAIRAADAVSEGLAQHYARAICAQAGESAGFTAFTEAITAEPPSLSESERLTVGILSRAFTFPYIEGESFVAAVLDARGAEAEALLFASPPRSRAEVVRPGWYLDPSSRPEHGFELEAALALVPPAFAAIEGMEFSLRELTGEDIVASNTQLGPERAQRMGGLIEVCQTQIGWTRNGERMAWGALFVFPDVSAGERFAALAEEASALRDKTLSEPGPLQVLESQVIPVAEELGVGTDTRKRALVSGREIGLRTLMVRRGRILLELTLSNCSLPDGAAEKLADRVLATASPGS